MPPSAGRKAGGGGGGSRNAVGNKVATAAAAGSEQGAAVTRRSRQQQQLDADDETNAGFGKYLRSQEGIEMMKLFVIANTLVVFMTMAWPQMQQSYQMLRSIFYGEADEDTTYPFFFVTILLGYSTGIWRLINDYFRREFETFLQEEAKANKYLLQDPHPSELAKGAATVGAPAPPPASTTPLPPEVSMGQAAVIAPVTSPGLEVDAHQDAGGAGGVAVSDEQEWLRYWRRRAASEGATDTEPAPSDSGSEPQFCSAATAPRQGLPPEPEGRMAAPGAAC